MPRNSRIDSLKYWLILLVIAGHIFSEFQDDRICAILYKWIYIYHMSLFIFLSGYFSRRKSRKEFYVGAWKILEPLVIIQIFWGIGSFIKHGSFSFIRILTPWWVLWYLLSLFYWRLLLQIIPHKIISNAKLILICTIIISFISGFLPFNRFLSLQRTLAFMPFFFAGYFARGRQLFLPNKYKPICLAFLFATILVPILFSNYLGDLNRAAEYTEIGDMGKRIFSFVLSIPMSIAFMNICPNISWTAEQGRYTLQYYIYHAFMINILFVFISKLDLPITFIFILIYFILIVFTLGLASYLSLFSKFTNPLSLIKERLTI